MRAIIAAFSLILGLSASATVWGQTAAEIEKLFEGFNDDKLVLNEKPLVVGDDSAPVTAVLFFAHNCRDSAYFFSRVFPTLKSDYIDKKKIRVLMYEYPLNWRDMQTMAGLRCVPAEKHYDAVIAASATDIAERLRRVDFAGAPDVMLPVLVRAGLTAEQARKCMGNLEALAYVEGVRRVAVENWGISQTPTLLINGDKSTALDNVSKVRDFLEKHNVK